MGKNFDYLEYKKMHKKGSNYKKTELDWWVEVLIWGYKTIVLDWMQVLLLKEEGMYIVSMCL